MRLKIKFLLLAVAPLVFSLALIAWAVQVEQSNLAQRQRLQMRTAIMDVKQDELRHYMALAMSTISPLYNLGLDDAKTKQQVMERLHALDYGPDGYFFVYDMQGVNLMHSRQPSLVGKNLLGLRDTNGEPTIRMLLERARTGGGFVVYKWNKPSTQEQAPKLGYVTVLDRWGWMVGTGMYLDDMEVAMVQLDEAMVGNVHATLLWIAGVGCLGLAFIFVSTMIFNLSERKVSDAKLLLLARQVVRSHEEERAYFSRELHDGIGQILVVAKLHVESAIGKLADTQEDARVALQRSLERIKDALSDVRGMSHRLRPVMLDTLGLTASLRSLGAEICGQIGADFDMEVNGQLPDLSDELKTVFFRVTQEALTNIHKHADCAHVRVLLDANAKRVQLTIADDGNGFDVAAVRAHPNRGIGLRNMRERIEAVGGQFFVESGPDGTKVVAHLSARDISRFNAQGRSTS